MRTADIIHSRGDCVPIGSFMNISDVLLFFDAPVWLHPYETLIAARLCSLFHRGAADEPDLRVNLLFVSKMQNADLL